MATPRARRIKDWFHETSQGWCSTYTTYRSLFDLPKDAPSNYNRLDELLALLRNRAELRDYLVQIYFKSGDNGRLWGKWDPQYQPAGACKVKD